MWRRLFRNRPALYVLLFCIQNFFPALNGFSDGPGLGNLTYTDAELFKPISFIKTPLGDGMPLMFKGYLVGWSQEDGGIGGGWYVYDVANPRSPKLVLARDDSSTRDIREVHVWSTWNNYIALPSTGTGGIAIWDWTNMLAPRRVNPQGSYGDINAYTPNMFWLFWQGPYIYSNDGSRGIRIIDVSNPAAPVKLKSLSGLGTGHGLSTVVLVGNVMVSNYSLFDASDPLNPVLVSSVSSPGVYSMNVTGNKIVGAGLGGAITLHDISDHKTIKSAGSIASGSDRLGYVSFQDGFGYFGVRKVQLSPLSLTATASVSIGGADFDFSVPVGNLMYVSNDHAGDSALVPHQKAPDTTGPGVNMHSPLSNATNQKLTTRVGVCFTDNVDSRTVNSATIIVRPVGGTALTGKYTCQLGIVNFWPDQQLSSNTAYEVVIPAGGVKDWVGNGVPSAFSFRFSTGATLTQPLKVTATPSSAKPVNTSVTFNATATGSGTISYSWNFGDGSAPTAFSTSSTSSHTYASPGHYSVVVTAKNSSEQTTSEITQSIYVPPTATAPRRSGTILYDVQSSTVKYVWSVNSDADSVTAIDAIALSRKWETKVGKTPRTLAQAPDGSIWVVNQGSATISVLNRTTGAISQTINLPHASRPYGIAFSPNGTAAYVTLQGTGKLLKLDPASKSVVASLNVSPTPRGIAISGDSSRIFVTRFVSPSDKGEIIEVDPATFAIRRTFNLAMDAGPDTEASGRGVPNYISSLSISPDGRRAWVPSKKDNTVRGSFRDGNALTFESTTRAVVSRLDLVSNTEVLSEREDLNDRDLPVDVAFSKYGDYVFICVQGVNSIDVLDAYTGDLVTVLEFFGLAPQGIVFNDDYTKLFIQNFMSRSVAVFDVSGFIDARNPDGNLLKTISTVTAEPLSSAVLKGKQIFYNAEDARMNTDGYISCASCHLDAESDGRVWDFTDRGEGLRNTISLIGRRGAGHGLVHWTANFDEIQDFENDVRHEFLGRGFMNDAQFNTGTRNQPLGDLKSGVSADLDALAAYVSSLDKTNPSPFRNADGSMTADALAGKEIFKQLSCHSCHSGADFTDARLHDVGTIKTSSGKRLGQTLTGIETPTLKGIWETAPYLHDGSAATVLDVLITQNTSGKHGATATLTTTQRQQLVAYLQQIDDAEILSQPPVVSISSPANGSTFSSGASFVINATASDPDGTVSKVDFYSGAMLLGSDSTSPYFFSWNTVADGLYNLSAKATDDVNVSISSAIVTVTVGQVGSISATKAAQPVSLSLHTEGGSDWGHWGLNAATDWNHKSGITAQISNITKVGTGTTSRYTDGTMSVSWTGGNPTASASSTTAGIFVAGAGNGFQITVPADQTLRILKIYCGVWKAQGRLEASLSDGTAPVLVDTSHGSTTGSANTVFNVQYRAGTSGQKLTVKWTVQTSHNTTGGGTVGWQGATLSTSAVSDPCAANTPPTASISSPAPGATYLAPASVAINGAAADGGGSVSKVEFFSGSTLLATDSGSPYSVTWSNVAAGNYSLTAKATDNCGSVTTSSAVSITVNSSSASSPAPAGSLIATKATQPASVSLSTEGTRDWSHWGHNTATDWNHKSGITAQISNITKLGTGTMNRYTDGTCANSWTGGTPTASVSATGTGIYVAGVNNGFQITMPADTTTRTLRVYCGVWKSQGKLEASLSDGSAPGILDTSHGSTTGSANTVFTIQYKAAAAGQNLTVKWSVQTSHDTTGAGTVGWQAATLQ